MASGESSAWVRCAHVNWWLRLLEPTPVAHWLHAFSLGERDPDGLRWSWDAGLFDPVGLAADGWGFSQLAGEGEAVDAPTVLVEAGFSLGLDEVLSAARGWVCPDRLGALADRCVELVDGGNAGEKSGAFSSFSVLLAHGAALDWGAASQARAVVHWSAPPLPGAMNSVSGSGDFGLKSVFVDPGAPSPWSMSLPLAFLFDLDLGVGAAGDLALSSFLRSGASSMGRCRLLSGDGSGGNVLHAAVWSGNERALSAALSVANEVPLSWLSHVDDLGRTPLALAQDLGRQTCVAMLSSRCALDAARALMVDFD